MNTFPGRMLLGAVWGLASVLAAVPSPAQARTIYVRESGDDANNGLSAASALRTINEGATRARDGDTVLVGPGTYFEGMIGPPGFGSVRFLADRTGAGVGDPPGDVVVDATGFASGFEINNKLAVVIDGFVINSSTHGIHIKSGSRRTVVSNNNVSGARENGIYVQDSRDTVIFNNLVYANRDVGILITGNIDGSPGAWILSNTVYRNGDRGIFFSEPSGTTSANGLVLNNIAANNTLAGIQVGGPRSRATFMSAGNVTFANPFAETVADVTDKQADPLFIDPDGADNILGGIGYADDDFRLQQKRAGQAVTSPAVDAGSDLSRRMNLTGSTTRSDAKRDRGIVDAGYHYDNFSSPPANPRERIRPKKLYVSQTNGNDANDGATRATAVATLTRAFALARGGHLIAVLGGTYRESGLTAPSGKPARPVVVRGMNGAAIEGPAGESALRFGGVHNVTVDAMRISGAMNAIDISNSDNANIVIRRCRLTGNSGRGIRLSDSTNVQVVASIIEDNDLRGVQIEHSSAIIDRSSISGNGISGVWAFTNSTVVLSDTDLLDNRTDGILVESASIASIEGGTISGSMEGGARFRSSSQGALEDVDVLENNDVGVQVISSNVSLSGGRVLGSGIGVQSFVDPIMLDPATLTIRATHICDNRRTGVDAQATTVNSVDADLCANGEGLRVRGGSIDLSGGEIRANTDAGISAADAAMVKIRGAAISDNGGSGLQATRVDEVDVEDSTVHGNGGDGLNVSDSPAPKIVNNLVYDNRANGAVIGGDLVGSPDAQVRYNTFFRNDQRGLFIRGDFSSNSVIIGNIFRSNVSAGLQVSILSQAPYFADYNLSSANPYGSQTDPGPNDIIEFDPLFVAPDSGDFHLSQRAAGQGASSPAVNAGNSTAAASGMATKTTRTDKVADTGIVDLGYHYLP